MANLRRLKQGRRSGSARIKSRVTKDSPEAKARRRTHVTPKKANVRIPRDRPKVETAKGERIAAGGGRQKAKLERRTRTAAKTARPRRTTSQTEKMGKARAGKYASSTRLGGQTGNKTREGRSPGRGQKGRTRAR